MAQNPLSLPQQMQVQGNAPGKEPWADNAPSPRLVLTFDNGINENSQPQLSECISGYNFDLKYAQQSFIPRKPFDLAGTATNGGDVTGIMQLVKRNGAQTTIVCAGTAAYLWDGSSTFTSKATITAGGLQTPAYWSLGDYLVVADINKTNVVQQWDGTTYGNLTTGLSYALKAKYAFVQNSRIWLFNITYNGIEYPHMILVSKFEDPTTYDISTRGGATTVGGGSFSTGLEPFYILTPDLKPINGVDLFQNVMVISTLNGELWQITGTNAKDFAIVPFYGSTPSIGNKGIKNVGNDLVTVRQGGNVALLYATQAFGNALAADLSAWLPNTQSQITQINEIVYDVLNQKVLFFIPNKILVLFKDILSQQRDQVIGQPSPWSIYVTDVSTSFNTKAATYMYIPGTTNYSVFFGDQNGKIYNLNGTGSKDAGTNNVNALRKSRHIDVQVVNPWPWSEENITGHIRYHRNVNTSFSVDFQWDDEFNTTTSSVNIKGPTAGQSGVYFGGSVYFGGTYYFNQGPNSAGLVGSISLEPGGKGPGFYISAYCSSGVQFQVDSIELD